MSTTVGDTPDASRLAAACTHREVPSPVPIKATPFPFATS